jgi:DNA-directed RNA polymerase I, II, and III subunit RPABC5
MIIPVKCFTCGMVIADKYRYYQAEVRKRKLAKKAESENFDIDKVVYLTKEFHEKTPEGEVLDELNMNKMCCRRHFLTHVNID